MIDFELMPAEPGNPRLQEVWSYLAPEGGASFFLTWGAVDTWLQHLPPGHPVQLLTSWQAGRPVLACLLSVTRFVRHRVFSGRSLHLNTAGTPRSDFLHIEYNDVLLHPAAEVGPLLEAMLAFLQKGSGIAWDELVLPGLAEGSHLLGHILTNLSPGWRIEVDQETESPYVDLDSIRRSGRGYLTFLSTNTRRQIRRSIQAYAAEGELVTEEAGTLGEALEFFDELVALHQKSWMARGKPGAFADPNVRDFHRDLIRNCFADGQIQMLRVRAGKGTIACLYSFVYRRRVYFYQSGLRYSDEKSKHPGLVTHYNAVLHNLASGHGVYDFLAGGARYKMSLCTGTVPMVWCRLQRPRLRFRVEHHLRRLKRLASGRQSERSPRPSPR